MIPEDKLAEYRKLVEDATPGPWNAHRTTNDDGSWLIAIDAFNNNDSDYLIKLTGNAESNYWNDGEFISASRTMVPSLLDEVERLKNIANGFKIWGTDDCKSCDSGRISLYIWNKECISCNPKSYDQVETQIDRLTKQNQIMREALNKIATHDTLEGAKYNSYSTAYTGLVDFAAKALKEAGEVK